MRIILNCDNRLFSNIISGIVIILIAGLSLPLLAEPNPDQAEKETKPFDLVGKIMSHIGNANDFHIVGDIHLPLPCILYSFEEGWSVFMSSKFDHGYRIVDGYVMDYGVVKRIKSGQEFDREAEVEKFFTRADTTMGIEENLVYEYKEFARLSSGEEIEVERASTLFAMSGWIDFSISKNVFSLLLAALFMAWIFFVIAGRYKTRAGHAPKGIQSLLEPVFLFMRDEVVKPCIGPNYERYMPFIMSLFFFILINNLMGLIPIFPGSANVTGNISTTIALALFTFVLVTINGNSHYWQHIFWMPGVPIPIRIILMPIELAGMFIKPATLFIRLFAIISAGHIIILSLVGLIFLMGESGNNIGGAIGGVTIAIPFVFMMNLLELLVAVLQAFIFALLSSLYIGSAIEEHH